MAMPSSYRDKEFRKYVESPTRPNQTAVEVVGILQDAQGDQIEVNPDGSINVQVAYKDLKTIYSESLSIAGGVTTTLLSFTPLSNIKIIGIDVSGTNIAEYEVIKDASVINKKYTYFGGSLSAEFMLEGLPVLASQNIKVDVTHIRPFVGDFNATIKYIED